MQSLSSVSSLDSEDVVLNFQDGSKPARASPDWIDSFAEEGIILIHEYMSTVAFFRSLDAHEVAALNDLVGDMHVWGAHPDPYKPFRGLGPGSLQPAWKCPSHSTSLG